MLYAFKIKYTYNLFRTQHAKIKRFMIVLEFEETRVDNLKKQEFSLFETGTWFPLSNQYAIQQRGRMVSVSSAYVSEDHKN